MPPPKYIGTSINGYTITQFLGAGGMGEVYKAVHPMLRRVAAIKLLFQSSQAARFQNEAYIQSSIRHPNIAGMYEYCVFDNKPCIIMEYIEGQTLDRYLQIKGKLKNEELIGIFGKVLEAITHLHQNKIIHRDIKPSNIKITNDGTVKLLDFGISKATYTPKLTQQGYVIGTAEYMAPEQFRHELSPKSDIWSMGVLLYEISTGYLPFEDKNHLFIRHKVEKGQFTNPKLLNPKLSNLITDSIQKCLKVNPINRPSAVQLLESFSQKNHKNQAINLDSIKNQIDYLNNKYFRWASIAIVVLLIIWMIFPIKNPDSDTPKKKYIKIEIANFNNAELVLPNGVVMKDRPFFLERPEGKKLDFQVRLGDFSKSYTISPNYPDSTFKCDLDFY